MLWKLYNLILDQGDTKMEKNYGKMAANWWAKKIEEGNMGYPPRNIDSFIDILSNKINQIFSINAHVNISSRDSILTDIAMSTKMTANIPKGYEMTIFPHTGVSVYNEFGLLVDSF